MSGLGLLAAVDDRALIGAAFQPFPFQRGLLEQVEKGPRIHVWALGRRSGKTTTAAAIALWDCLLRPELDGRMRPGETRHAIVVATNVRQARVAVKAALSMAAASPILSGFIESETDDEIRFTNNTRLTAFPCSSRSARGWPASTVIFDELSFFLDDSEGPQVADAVWQALVPSTAQFGAQARVIALSTPYGTSGLFARLFEQARTGELGDAVATRASTAEVNPTISAEFLASEQARDPESFRSEYEALFVGSGGSFLDPEVIADAVDDRGPLPPEACLRWVAGLDPAFSSDPFGLALVGVDPFDRQRLRVGLARRWAPQKRRKARFGRSIEEERNLEDEVLDEVAAVCLAYNATVTTDQYRSAGIADYLRRRGLHVRVRPMGADSKTEVFQKLRARLMLGALELYEEPQLLAELRRLTTRHGAGKAAVRNPRVAGSHGDLAQALAMAVAQHDAGGIPGPPREPRPPRAGLPAIANEELLDLAQGVHRDRTRTRKWFDEAGGIRDMSF